MPYKQNLHTHSSFCDGRNTPEEIVQEAIERGFDSVGFSMHSYVPFSPIGSGLDGIEAYKKEIRRLKEVYEDRLKIYLGIEYDIFSNHSPEGFEYSIGSVHCLESNGVCFDFDGKLDKILNIIQQYFHGDSMQLAKSYYETVATIPRYGNFDILGHFDLIIKNNEKGRFLDTSSAQYLGYAKDAIHAIKGKISMFEVNTGCVARGYRSSAYPQMELLREFKECGFGAVITSDCHKKEFLDFCFDDAKAMLKAVGYDCIYVLTDRGFVESPLDER